MVQATFRSQGNVEGKMRAKVQTGSRVPYAASAFATATLGRAVALCACTVLWGCTQSVPPPEVLEKVYSGPAISVEPSAGNHVVVANMPSPGWSVKLDRVLEGYRFQGAYVTLQEPNPAFSYAQVMVTQRVATNIREGETLKVFVRFHDFNGEPLGDDGYTFAGGSENSQGSTVTPASLK
jgi:hypothetical protein